MTYGRHELWFEPLDSPGVCMECYTNEEGLGKCRACLSVVCYQCVMELAVRWKHEICRPYRGTNV